MLNIFNNTKHNTKKICYIAMYHPEKFVPVDTDEDIDYVEPEFSVDLIYSRILKDAKTNGSIGYYQYNNYIHFVRVYVDENIDFEAYLRHRFPISPVEAVGKDIFIVDKEEKDESIDPSLLKTKEYNTIHFIKE